MSRHAEAEQAACDARVVKPNGRARQSIPPARRRAVLVRDGHRCRRCGATRFLEIHHERPVSAGGGNEAENLVTLCSRCHRRLHEHSGRATTRPASDP